MCFLAGVLDPPILPTWDGPATAVMATASAHRAAWFASTWLITLSIAAGLAAVELLVDGVHLHDRDRPATGPICRIPWRIAVPAVPSLHRRRHRGAGPPDA